MQGCFLYLTSNHSVIICSKNKPVVVSVGQYEKFENYVKVN